MLHQGSLSPSLPPSQTQNCHPTHNLSQEGGRRGSSGRLSEHPATDPFNSSGLTLHLGLRFSPLLESHGCLSEAGSPADKNPRKAAQRGTNYQPNSQGHSLPPLHPSSHHHHQSLEPEEPQARNQALHTWGYRRGGRIPSFGGTAGKPTSPFLRRLPLCLPPTRLITSMLLNWAKGARARVRACVCRGGRGFTPHTWGAGWRGCWLPAQERAPSPSPSRWRIVSSNRWTEPEGRGRADGVRDGSALAGPRGALTKAGAGRRGAPYQR